MATRRQAAPLDLLAIASTGTAGDWSPRGLRARCASLRHGLQVRGVADDVLAAWWPGGTENPGRDRERPGAADLGAWVRCYGHLVALGREAHRPSDAARAVEDDLLHAAIAAAAADAPEYVTLSIGQRIGVYPKSVHALEELRWLGQAIDTLTDADLIATEGGAIPSDTTALRSLAVRLWVWIVTYAGAALPYADDAQEPEPPAWTGEISPADLYALAAAFRRVNGEREAVMAKAFPRTRDGFASRLDFVGFLTAHADAKGRDPLDVLRRWSRGRAVAAAVTAAISADEAQRAAERQRSGAPDTGPLEGVHHRGG